ncbi:2-C-methyl-D-erythritol 2,4-cyclodiphosphate synthase [Halobacteroides halobius DSM 5150]|uniref:2-C-methyl-D-erythritol 2,4-cyclodiphosphate synthase n=1 Tax=Halobacteroides halobius (strain ATCC 35273 / DSM 5150 / MD-1) TaxID=748449 RepID=L0K720_HALHC|nr:2-C-methyl-D-erythritol 2,4-cyclodiphosphate synthase [Halobacteroides halobius]AGB40174.1 2-C-methyl-D-erythritol 2,4-cyclodiphosphate synthase [Halobacteroides halobius DSM 5150]
MRVGIGYDVHALKKGEELILGGTRIDYKWGLEGHSDADVLLHAIKDALLGAVGEGDIGQHFPDDDPQYKGISSLALLEEVAKIIAAKGFVVNNLDTVIQAQKPKLAPYLNQMRKKIAQTLKINETRVNIKATTTEHLGFIGRKEGIAAQAIVSLNEED